MDKMYGLYKRIMKHDLKAVDEIESLDEAKKIIKMITGNTYLIEKSIEYQKLMKMK